MIFLLMLIPLTGISQTHLDLNSGYLLTNETEHGYFVQASVEAEITKLSFVTDFTVSHLIDQSVVAAPSLGVRYNLDRFYFSGSAELGFDLKNIEQSETNTETEASVSIIPSVGVHFGRVHALVGYRYTVAGDNQSTLFAGAGVRLFSK